MLLKLDVVQKSVHLNRCDHLELMQEKEIRLVLKKYTQSLLYNNDSYITKTTLNKYLLFPHRPGTIKQAPDLFADVTRPDDRREPAGRGHQKGDAVAVVKVAVGETYHSGK